MNCLATSAPGMELGCNQLVLAVRDRMLHSVVQIGRLLYHFLAQSVSKNESGECQPHQSSERLVSFQQARKGSCPHSRSEVSFTHNVRKAEVILLLLLVSDLWSTMCLYRLCQFTCSTNCFDFLQPSTFSLSQCLPFLFVSPLQTWHHLSLLCSCYIYLPLCVSNCASPSRNQSRRY